ncbi:MAG: hypothetical protein AABY00_01520 [Nanoarchaeota archaeon]
MAKSRSGADRAVTLILSIILWITGVLVALAVGFGMTDGILVIPGVESATIAAGWVVIVLTVVGAVLAIIDKLTE